MSENTYNKVPSRDEIQKMSTPELMEFLRLDSCNPANSTSDEELIFYILEVLETREDAQESAPKQNPKEAFEKFQKLYLVSTEDSVSADHASIKRPEKKRVNHLPKWLRSAAAVAAVFVMVVVVGSFTIKATGLDPWALFANWTQDVFFFSTPDETSPPVHVPDMAELEQTLAECNVEFACVPHWLPEGYRLFDVYTSVTPKNTTITAEFTNGTKKIGLLLRSFSTAPNPGISEKNDQEVKLYLHNGCVYYLYSNTDISSASWMVENWECSLYGPVTTDALKHIISSFYEGK